MRKLMKKLRSGCGETLVEAIASILIFTFSSIILLSMVMSAADINRTAQQADLAMSNELNIAEAQTESSKSGSLTITAGDISQSIPVEYYYKDAGSLYTFTAK